MCSKKSNAVNNYFVNTVQTVTPENAVVPTMKTETASARYVSSNVAHELNNIFTVIQGYADRLFLKNAHDPALQAHLKLISDASRRAATVVRDATPRNTPVKSLKS